MPTRTESEIPSVVTFTLKQFYDWLGRRAETYEALWRQSSGEIKDVLAMEADDFYQEGGYRGMTPVKFYMMDDFLKSFEGGIKFYWTIAGSMRLPLHLWDHIVLDVPTCRLHLLDSGKNLFNEFCASNHLVSM